MRYLLLLALLPTALFASDFPILQGDEVLSRDEVQALTAQHVVEFYEGGKSRYSVGGSYSYTYQGGGTAFGKFEIGPDGLVCIQFNNGRGRCDRFVRSHGRTVMITETGDRFPIRP